MKAPPSIASAARQRIKSDSEQIKHSLKMIAEGKPGDAEPDTLRKTSVLQARTGMPRSEALRVAPKAGSEAVWGQTIDFVDVSFLERGMIAARAICRIITRGGQGFGTGFLISPRLLLTNNHVITSKSAAREIIAEFEYERDLNGTPKAVTRYALDPESVFLTCDQNNLDYTIVALGQRVSGSRSLQHLGCLPLSSARNKHALGDFVNIIQHPDGRFKEAVLRENQLVGRPKSGTVLHYVADTEPGSSGSPVLNVKWQVVALHHWGGPHRELFDDAGVRVPRTVNEGIRISAIVLDLETRRATLSEVARGLVEEALQLLPEDVATTIVAGRTEGGDGNLQSHAPFAPVTDPSGVVTWNIPLSVSIRLGGTALAEPVRAQASPMAALPMQAAAGGDSEARVEVDEDYSNRSGYDPGFLPGFVISLPGLSKDRAKLAARNKEAERNDDPFELKYEHFSVVMNGKRQLAFLTATNIDGKRAKDVNRDTLEITDPREADEDSEALLGAEASETWFADPRIDESEQTPVDLYAGQTTFDADGNPILDRRTRDHQNRMFQRGHLTRRQDPLWGTDEEIVLRAHADTFHVTNCAPQVGYFNMGKKKVGAEAKKHPGGTLHWRALEDYVLENARADQERVTVFTGAVFDDENDFEWSRGRPDMKGFRAPRKFWKVVVRIEDDSLRATALLADQSPLIDFLPEILELGVAEAQRVAFNKVARYAISVPELEKMTGLDFGDEVRAADTFTGGEAGKQLRAVSALNELHLNNSATPNSKKRRKPPRAASASRRTRRKARR